MNVLIYLDNCRENMTFTRKFCFAKIILALLLTILFCASVNGVRWIDEKCMTDCKRYENYHYCYTGRIERIKCQQILEEDDFNEAYYPTIEEGVWCTSRCKSAGYSYEWCFTDAESKSWSKCRSDQSIDKTALNKMVKKIKNSNTCSNLRQKRSIDENTANNLLATIAWRSSTDRIPILQNSPVINYSVMNAPRLLNYDDVELPIRIRARIRSEDLQVRTRMSSRLSTLMDNMHRLQNDERGHLIAASFGGTNRAFNIVPQDRGVNRRVGSNSHWLTFENAIRAFINRDERNNVDFHVYVLYGDLPESRRPTAFLTRAFFYIGESLHIDTGFCYFSNNPGGPTENEQNLELTRWFRDLRLRDEGFDFGNWNQ